MMANTVTRTEPLADFSTDWAMYSLVLIVLALSSLAPFMRFAGGDITVTPQDLLSSLLVLVTWLPFLAAALALTNRRSTTPAVAIWLGHGLLLLVAPTAHAGLVVTADAWLRGIDMSIVWRSGNPGFLVFTALGLLQYCIILALLHAHQRGRSARASRRAADELVLAQARLEAQLARARNTTLRAQLQPHFLFNTLNSISVLAASDPGGAQTMIRRLSELLRAIVDTEDQPVVPLKREIELVRAYLAILQVRFRERLRAEVIVSPAAESCLVPPFLLQPVVENAIQHAVAAREEGGTVRIGACLAGEQLCLTVADDGPGFPAANPARGVGLRNTKERLKQIGEGTLTIENDTGGGCLIRIELPVDQA